MRSRLSGEGRKPCDSTAYLRNWKSPTETTELAEIVKRYIGPSGADQRIERRGNGRSGDRLDSLLLDLT